MHPIAQFVADTGCHEEHVLPTNRRARQLDPSLKSAGHPIESVANALWGDCQKAFPGEVLNQRETRNLPVAVGDDGVGAAIGRAVDVSRRALQKFLRALIRRVQVGAAPVIRSQKGNRSGSFSGGARDCRIQRRDDGRRSNRKERHGRTRAARDVGRNQPVAAATEAATRSHPTSGEAEGAANAGQVQIAVAKLAAHQKIPAGFVGTNEGHRQCH